MNEKRFISDDGTIRDNFTARVYYCLNLSGNELCDFLNWQHEKIEELSDENGQLKKDGIETINELQKCRENNKKALKNLETVFDVIDNKIKEFQDGEYGDLPCNTIHILLDLKEELSYEMSRRII